MNTKISSVIILITSLILSSCGQRDPIAESFIEYDSTEFITENSDLSHRIPVFSIAYPPEWESDWVGDSGVIALLIASGDVEAAFFGQDYSGASMMIVPVPYSGEKLTDMFYTTLDGGRVLEPSKLTSINGQRAAIAEYSHDGDLVMEAVVAQAKWSLLTLAHFPAEKEAEFRPLIDAMISSIEIK